MNAVIENNPTETPVLTGTVNDKRKHGAAVKKLVDLALIASTAHVAAAEGKRDLFRACMVVRMTITHEGRPDFGGNSTLWKSGVGDLLIEPFETAGLKTVEARRTFMNSVYQNGLRALIMEEFIVEWVKANNSAAPGSEAFKKAVRAEYTAAKRNIPTNSDYFVKTEEKPGPGKKDPKVTPPAEILEKAITEVHTSETAYDLLVVLHAIQRLQTEAAAQMRALVKGRKNNIPNRPAVRMALSDLQAQAEAMLLIAESKADEETYKTLALVAFSPIQSES